MLCIRRPIQDAIEGADTDAEFPRGELAVTVMGLQSSFHLLNAHGSGPALRSRLSGHLRSPRLNCGSRRDAATNKWLEIAHKIVRSGFVDFPRGAFDPIAFGDQPDAVAVFIKVESSP